MQQVAPSPGNRKREIAHVVVLVVLASGVFFFRLGDRTLWSGMEGRVAEIAAEMIDRGDYIMPHINGRIELTKPPLAHWLVAGSFRAFGRTAFAARLPSVIAVLGTVLAVYFLGRRMAGHWCGIFAAGTLATALDFVWMGRCARIDNLFTLFVVLAMLLFYIGYTGRHRAPFWVASFACMGLAVMAKGPAGLGIPLGSILLYLLLRRDLKAIICWPTLVGLGVFVLLALPWHLAVFCTAPPDQRRFFFVGQLGEWLEGEREAKWLWAKTFWKYVPYFMKGFFPWSIFLPVGVWVAVRRRAATLSDGMLLPLLWCLWGLVGFSVSGTKAARYLLPIYPAAALVVGFAWARLHENCERSLQRGMVISAIVVAAVEIAVVATAAAAAAFAPAVLRFLEGRLNEHDYRSSGLILDFLHRYRLMVVGVVTGAAAALVAAAWAARRGRARLAFVLVAGVLAVQLLVHSAVVLPRLDEVNSAKPFALYVRETVPPNARIIYSGDWLHEFRFYLGRNVEFIPGREESLRNARAALESGRCFHLVLLDEDYDELEDLLHERARLLSEARIDYHRAYLLVTR